MTRARRFFSLFYAMQGAGCCILDAVAVELLAADRLVRLQPPPSPIEKLGSRESTQGYYYWRADELIELTSRGYGIAPRASSPRRKGTIYTTIADVRQRFRREFL